MPFDLAGYHCACRDCSPVVGKTYSEQFRHECEIRYVAAMPTNTDRKRYLEGVEKSRGSVAADRIRADVWKTLKEIA